MAKFIYKDASLVLNSVDLSDHVVSLTLDVSADLQEDHAMGDSTKTRLVGLKDWSVSIDFRQDFAASEVDATLWGIMNGAVAVPIVIKPTSAAVSATNPSYSGNVVLESYPPLGGSVGDIAGTSVSLQAAGDLTRATA